MFLSLIVETSISLMNPIFFSVLIWIFIGCISQLGGFEIGSKSPHEGDRTRPVFGRRVLFKTKSLSVIGYLAISNRSGFLKRLHNVEKLVLTGSSQEEIFPYEELFDEEKHDRILPQLRELKLLNQPLLTCLWKEDTQPSLILHNLENLKVSQCGKLKILVLSSISFQNLINLEILKCHRLINLVTFSMAISLVQLKKMSFSECEKQKL